MDNREVASEQIAADANLGQLEYEGAGVANGADMQFGLMEDDWGASRWRGNILSLPELYVATGWQFLGFDQFGPHGRGRENGYGPG